MTDRTTEAGTAAVGAGAGAPDAVLVRDVRALGGASPWSRGPAVVGEVVPGASAERARRALARCVDALAARGAAPDAADAASAADDAPGAWADAVRRLASALQRAAGSDVAWSAVARGPEDGTRTVVVAYEQERVGTASVRRAAELLRAADAGDAPDVGEAVEALRDRLERERLGPTTRAVAQVALEREIPVRRAPGESVIQLGLGRWRRRVQGTLTDLTSVVAADVAASAGRTLDLLGGLGVPVPRDEAAEADAVGRTHRVLVIDGRVVAVAEEGADGVADRTAAIHPDNGAVCAFAADVVGLPVAEIVLRSPDVSVPFGENGALVLGVEATPRLDLPGIERALAEGIVDALFPPGAPSRVPIVAVTGTNGKTTTTRLVAHLLRAAGRRVGFTTTDGVYYEDCVLLEGDMTGPMAADMILSHPRVDAAVLETARGGILRAGLGFDACDVGVVLNVSADHLGLRGIHTVDQLAEVKRVIPAAVRPGGWAVLNADDPRVLAMRDATAGRVLLFSAGGGGRAALAAHVADGGSAVVVDAHEGDEWVVLREGPLRTPLVAVADVPLTLRGAARFQVANVLAATGAAWSAGVPLERLREGLRAFVPSRERTPGRMNVLRARGATVVVDYAHNVAAVEALLEYARRVEATRRIGVLAIPGDRRDEDIRAFGALARPLDVAVFKEHPGYRRGRAPGETARLMRDGLAAAGGDPARARTALDEDEAIACVLEMLRPGDLVLFVADEVHRVLEAFEGAGA